MYVCVHTLTLQLYSLAWGVSSSMWQPNSFDVCVGKQKKLLIAHSQRIILKYQNNVQQDGIRTKDLIIDPTSTQGWGDSFSVQDWQFIINHSFWMDTENIMYYLGSCWTLVNFDSMLQLLLRELSHQNNSEWQAAHVPAFLCPIDNRSSQLGHLRQALSELRTCNASTQCFTTLTDTLIWHAMSS